MLEGEQEKLVHMEERLGLRVIGQDDAIRRCPMPSAAIRAGSGRSESHPIGSFMLLGPDGRRQD